MEPKEIKEVTDFIVKGAEGKIANLTEDEAKEFEAKAIKIISEASNDLVIAKLSPIMNMDIIRMNIHFFDNLPKIWACVQNATEICVREA